MPNLIPVQEAVRTCDRCPLHLQCKNPVPMSGGRVNPEGDGLTAKFIVLGEAPGRVEDHRGVPFSGPAGQLLRATLRRAGAGTDDVVFVNAVSCWPHDKGTPTTEEVNACRVNLRAQLDAVETDYVLVTGATALSSVLPHVRLKHASGRPIQVHGRWMYPIYHPSYVLRDPTQTGNWKDQIEKFVMMTKGLVDVEWLGEWQTCLYCGKLRVEGTQTCRSRDHINKWRRDQEWKAYHHQPTLLDF